VYVLHHSERENASFATFTLSLLLILTLIDYDDDEILLYIRHVLS